MEILFSPPDFKVGNAHVRGANATDIRNEGRNISFKLSVNCDIRYDWYTLYINMEVEKPINKGFMYGLKYVPTLEKVDYHTSNGDKKELSDRVINSIKESLKAYINPLYISFSFIKED